MRTWIVWGLVLAGCSGGEAARDPERLADMPEEAWTVADTLFVIGSVDGDDQDLLYAPRRPRFLTPGVVGVLTGYSEIRRYDIDGRYLGSLGRKGQGPGEFRSGLWWAPYHGGAVVLDSYHVMIVLDPTGVEVGRRVLDPRANINVRAALLGSGRLVALDWPLSETPSAIPGNGQIVRDTVLLWTVGLDDEAAVELAWVPANPMWLFMDPRGSGVSGLGVPLGPNTTLAAHADFVAVSEGVDYRIAFYSADGQQQVGLALERDPEPLTPTDLDAWVRTRERIFRERGAPPEAKVLPIEDPPLPETLPSYLGLLFDDLGCLWARHAPLPEGKVATWDVLDPAGAYLAQVAMPSGFRLTDVKGDTLVGLRADELGVEYVVGLRLTTEASRTACGDPFDG